jgi:predicted kinase
MHEYCIKPMLYTGDMNKPLLVVVSGAPGSGKTTLAAKLADHMRLLHIERDMLFHGMQYTYGDARVNKAKSMPVFYNLLEYLLKANVSVVTDGTLYKDQSEKDMLALFEHARVINVHCRAENTRQRFYDREITRHGKEPEWLPTVMEKLRTQHHDMAEPLGLEWSTIKVETTEGYKPNIVEVTEEISKIAKEDEHA